MLLRIVDWLIRRYFFFNLFNFTFFPTSFLRCLLRMLSCNRTWMPIFIIWGYRSGIFWMFMFYMHIKLNLSNEILRTQRTFEWFFNGVRQNVSRQHVRSAKLFIANFTKEWFYVQMSDQVFTKIMRLLETFSAYVAYARLFTGVDASMSIHIAQFHEGFTAKVTLILFRSFFHFT